MRVLVVEDAPLQARLAQIFMRQAASENIQVDLAFACQTAREKIYAVEYDIILMDFGLPDGSGLAFAKQLRAEGITAMIIGVSGNYDNVLPEDRDRAGLDGGFRKPFTIQEARQVLEMFAARKNRMN